VQDPNSRPDLIVSKVTASASSVEAGASLMVTDTTKNLGVDQAAASMTFIYFSLDPTLDPGDTLIGNRPLGVLNPGSVSSGSTQVTIPANAPAGTRYLIVLSDGPQTVSESNEANNTRTKSITVPGPDLLVSSLSAPSSATSESTITVNDATKNQGSRPAGASTTIYYLSIDNTYDAGDTLIGNRPVGALLNGASNAGTANVTIPAGTVARTYFIIARADGGEDVAETKETNNTRAFRIVVR
jgi:subtilase family serine protease